ncbi:MAG: MFS transporter [Candidatus Rokubacteria bacterium]|nr:MFS transporter [Candidatus Rokubacteria bacterium]
MLTRPLLLCYAICAVVHLASVGLSTLLPFHVVDLGGSRTQVGLLFSIMTVVSMVLRPAVGGWIDRIGARPVILPGIATMVGVTLALQLPRRPEAVIAVMAFAGVANALVNTTANVLTARASTARHRGEAMSLYYLSSSLAIAVAPPAALALYRGAGMPVALAAVTALALVLLAVALAVPRAVTARVPGARAGFRFFSRHALPVTAALVLTTIGHSSIYAFVPLYAIGRGQGAVVVWFFAVYSIWLIACRAVFGGLSDRIGRVRVAVPAMALTAAAYLVLAVPPSPASLIAAAVLLGSGNSVLYPTLIAVVLDRTPDRERGVALGSASAAWDLGVVVGSALVGFIADRVAFGAGFAVAGGAAALGAVAFVVSERRQLRPAAAPVA